jgi:thiamine kinase-like enzyme
MSRHALLFYPNTRIVREEEGLSYDNHYRRYKYSLRSQLSLAFETFERSTEEGYRVMNNPFDLTTTEGLRTYLRANGRSDEADVMLLSGGTANYVYRVTSSDGSMSIFKHAAPYLHSNKSFVFDPVRMDYEASILETFNPINGESLFSHHLPTSAVHAVRTLSYDRKHKLLHIEDGGDLNLKDAYADSKLDIPYVGRELAKWIATLHNHSKNLSVVPSNHYGSSNNPVAVDIYRYSYNNLHMALSQFGHDPQLAHLINKEFGSLLQTDDECVCHGDFWPGNVLARFNEIRPFKLTVVDWEMVRRGTSATDVGQFAAEAFLLDRFRGGRKLLPAFLEAYIKARRSTLGRTWLRRMVVHWAVHVAFWPTSVIWTDREGTQKLVDIGVGALKSVLEDYWENLMESPLLRDVPEAYASLLERP